VTRALATSILLALVLTACGTGSSGSSHDVGRIRGVVMLGPMCPVVTEASPCPDRPVPDMKVRATRQGDLAATAVTDADGRFTMQLAAGSYTLQAVLERGGPGMSTKSVDVSVAAGATVDVTVQVNTGIL
jgi:hypothetical protein